MDGLLTALKELLESLCVRLPNVITGTSLECQDSVNQLKPALFTLISIAIVVGLLYRLFREKKIDANKAYEQLDNNYIALYQSAMVHPHVIDPNFTYHYDEHVGEKRLVYEAYAFQVWIVYETIYDMLCLGERPSILAWTIGWLKGCTSGTFLGQCRLAWRQGSWDPVRRVVQREAKRSMSRLPKDDWLTWRTALDIEARLHIKWFVIEDRFALTFKRRLRDHVITHYGSYISKLKRDAFERYDRTGVLEHLERLADRGRLHEVEEPPPVHGFEEGMRILLQSRPASRTEVATPLSSSGS